MKKRKIVDIDVTIRSYVSANLDKKIDRSDIHDIIKEDKEDRPKINPWFLKKENR